MTNFDKLIKFCDGQHAIIEEKKSRPEQEKQKAYYAGIISAFWVLYDDKTIIREPDGKHRIIDI